MPRRASNPELASLSSIRSAVGELERQLDTGELPPLLGFVGNAGLQMTSANRASMDGLELTFAVNVLANHLFVRLLTGRFAPPSRIVITTSDTHFGDFRHNLGMVPATGLARDAGPVQRFAMRRVMPLLTLTPLSVNARTAGEALAGAVIGPPPADSGAYLNLTVAERSSEESYDQAREDELWAAADILCRLT